MSDVVNFSTLRVSQRWKSFSPFWPAWKISLSVSSSFFVTGVVSSFKVFCDESIMRRNRFWKAWNNDHLKSAQLFLSKYIGRDTIFNILHFWDMNGTYNNAKIYSGWMQTSGVRVRNASLFYTGTLSWSVKITSPRFQIEGVRGGMQVGRRDCTSAQDIHPTSKALQKHVHTWSIARAISMDSVNSKPNKFVPNT